MAAEPVTPRASRPTVAADDAELVKVSLNLPRSILAKLERLAASRGLNKTTVIRKAIDLEDFIDGITTSGGKILVKEGKGGDLKEVIFR